MVPSHQNHHHHQHSSHRDQPLAEELSKKTLHAHEEAEPHHEHERMSDPAHGHEGHDHHRMMIDDFRRRFWISLMLTVPVLALSPMIQHWFGFTLAFPGSGYLLFALSSIIYFFGGFPFLKGLAGEIGRGAPGMMTLIGMAISVAYFYSTATTFGLRGEDFFWELATLIDIMLLGHWIEMKSVMSASRALELLVTLMPSEAHRLRNGEVETVRVEDLSAGDVILIRPGEKAPADGTVSGGESFVNESMLTGESVPVKKTAGQRIIGGSINGNGSLQVRVEHTGKDSYLSKVVLLVQEAQRTKSRMQNLSDRAAKWLTYIALTAGVATLAYWLAAGKDLVFALERMVTVLVISCPHALGLAVPLVVAISTAVSARHGLLIRNRTAFEASRKISAIVFDKTGTLTQGAFGVNRMVPLQPGMDEKALLRLAGALEQQSEHPIAAGIVEKAKQEHIRLPAPRNFEAITGKGVQGEVEGKRIQVVSPGYLKEAGIDLPVEAAGTAAETEVYILADGQLAGYIALADAVRKESAGAIHAFRDHGIKVYMATGDNERVARAVSDQLRLDGYFAGVLPHEKVDIVRKLQEQGEMVAMTGDGINDAPALAQADVGIAVGSGTDVAAETADIILVKSNPRDIAGLILFGRATYRKMVQNLIWATAYNAFAIPLAAGVLYSTGFVLSPAIGAVMMSLSTVIVAVNAQLLKGQIGK